MRCAIPINPLYRQKCATACGILLLMALSFHMAAVIAPTWALEGTTVHHPFEGIGLWRKCTWNQTAFDVDCISLVFRKDNPAWLTTLQVLESFSLGILAGAVMSALVARRRAYRHNQPPCYFLVFLNVVTALLIFIGLLIYGLGVKTSTGNYSGDFNLGWAYALDITVLLITCTSLPISAYLLAIVRKFPYAEMYPAGIDR